MQKQYITRKKNLMEAMYASERRTIPPASEIHAIMESIVRLENDLTLAPEKLVLRQADPYFTFAADPDMPDFAQVNDKYLAYLADNNDVTRDALNVAIKDYAEMFDSKYGTHYLSIAKYGEFNGAAVSYKDQRGMAIEHYVEVKYTNHMLTEIQHDFVANIALNRHELHVNGANYLMQTKQGQKLYRTFATAFDKAVFDHMGFGDSSALQQSFDRLNDATQVLSDTIKSGDDIADDLLDQYIDAKEELNVNIEMFLAEVDRAAGTSYAPKADHRASISQLRDIERVKIQKALSAIKINGFPPIPPISDVERQPQIIKSTPRANWQDYMVTYSIGAANNVVVDNIPAPSKEAALSTAPAAAAHVVAAKKEDISGRDPKLEALTQRLTEGYEMAKDSEHFKLYLSVMSKFHNYSANNCILIALQKPDATRVASYNKWRKEFSRHVKKGEKAISIFAPRQGHRWVKQYVDDDKGNPIYDENGDRLTKSVKVEYTYFTPAPVFDVSQTDGKPLPSICNELTQAVAEADRLIADIIAISPVDVRFGPVESGAKGYYHHDDSDKYIMVKEGMSDAQTIKTLLHEIAHAKLGHGDKDCPYDRATRELQAESVAYVVSGYLGIDTGDYTFEYLASWNEGKTTDNVKKQLDIVQKTASGIINNINQEYNKAEDYEVTFNVYECAEYPALGECHEGIANLDEALEILDSVPSERLNAIPAVAINLHKTGTPVCDDVEYIYCYRNVINLEMPPKEIIENEEAKRAIAETIEKRKDAEVRGDVPPEIQQMRKPNVVRHMAR